MNTKNRISETDVRAILAEIEEDYIKFGDVFERGRDKISIRIESRINKMKMKQKYKPPKIKKEPTTNEKIRAVKKQKFTTMQELQEYKKQKIQSIKQELAYKIEEAIRVLEQADRITVKENNVIKKWVKESDYDKEFFNEYAAKRIALSVAIRDITEKFNIESYEQ